MRKKRGISTKGLIALLALTLLIGCSLGGSLAWLKDTQTIENTFTVGDINISLVETTGREYKIIPGVNITKDPKVTVEANSEACWLFVQVVESNWPEFMDGDARKVDYKMDEGWIPLDGQKDVYYREVSASAADQPFQVLMNNQVTVSRTLTKAEINSVKAQPTLSFTAYAIQKEGFDTVDEAWNEVKPATP